MILYHNEVQTMLRNSNKRNASQLSKQESELVVARSGIKGKLHCCHKLNNFII